mmetsp:Transcript_17986/g.2932  ORF Transcript_17986/g.2932 Transcript_17986/m.2932 type:complete len:137 (-) Transcript_17986:902-1312(-)
MQPSPTLSEGPMTPSRLPARTCFNKYFAPIGPGSSRGALFNMSSSAIGAGLLSLPYAISHCGLILGLILIVLGAVSSALYYRIVIKGMDESNISTFIDLANKLFGNCAKVVVEILIIVTLFGLICAYLTIVCNYVC